MPMPPERLAQIRSLNVMDDALFQKVAEDPAVCEEILRTVLEDPGLTVEEVLPHLAKSDGENEEFPRLSGRVAYFKESNEGRSTMSDLIEEYAKEYAEEYAREQRFSALADAVCNLMQKGTESVEALLELMGIPEADRPAIVARL